MFRRRSSWIALAVIFLVGFTAYVIKERNLKYHPYKTALFWALAGNDFSRAYADETDLEQVRREYSFLADAPSERARVLSLIEHVDANIEARESWTVRAVDIVRLGGAACEVHALAVAVLEAFGTKARWIGGVKDSIGFGYLEAHVEGRWELFVLRDVSRRALGVSALELYRSGQEPSINIRAFYSRSGERLQAVGGPAAVAVFPLANLVRHPELEVIFTSDRGAALSAETFSVYDYVFDWTHRADDEWIQEERVMEALSALQDTMRYRRRRALASLIDAFDRAFGLTPGYLEAPSARFSNESDAELMQ